MAPDIWQKYRNRVLATSSTNLYFRRHTYVITADLFADGCSFAFSPDTESPGPFVLRVEVDDGDCVRTSVQDSFLITPRKPQLYLPFGRDFARYTIRLYLDKHLTYAGEYDEIPF